MFRIGNVNVLIHKKCKYLFMITYAFVYIIHAHINTYMNMMLTRAFYHMAFTANEPTLLQLINIGIMKGYKYYQLLYSIPGYDHIWLNLIRSN